MSQSLSDIILHIVFSTKDREPLIHTDIEEELYRYISGVCRNFDSPIIIINGVADHLHLLLNLAKTLSSSKLISDIKSNSSRWIKTKGTPYRNFSWQSGYGAFSVSRTNVDSAAKYISLQKEHHKILGFKEEYLSMLNRAHISYDEKFLWN